MVGWSDVGANTRSRWDLPQGCWLAGGGTLIFNTDTSSTDSCSSTRKCLCTLLCQPGTYQDQTGQTSCKSCSAGTYQDQAAQNDCKSDCNSGSYIVSDKSACLVCEKGQWQNQDGASDCKICGKGKYNDQTQRTAETDCKDCGTGKYNDQTERTSEAACKSCEKGKYNDKLGRTSDCKVCQGGKYTSDSGTELCFDCDAGQFNIDDEAPGAHKACNACPSGQISAPGTTFCYSCPVGTYNTSNVTEPCRNCPAGFKSETIGSGQNVLLTCTACDHGEYQSEAGQPFCLPCIPGKYNNQENQTECKSCGVNEFTNITKETSCRRCDIGKKSLAGSTACQACSAGEAGTPCIPCFAGKFRAGSDKDTTRCKACSEGEYQPLGGQGSCLPCIPGKYNDEKNQTKCKLCSINEFTNKTKETSCHRCGVGEKSNPGSARCTKCDGGEAGTGKNDACESCQAGQYRSSSMDSKSCRACPTGWSSPEASTKCQQNAPGWSASKCDLDSGICKETKACPPGTKGNEERTACDPCPAGQTSFLGSVSCMNCAKGKYASSEGMNECTSCPSAWYQPQENEPSTKCTKCPSGWGAIKDKNDGKGSPGCLDLNWKRPEDCTNEQYLDNRLVNDPSKNWNCVTCPQGGACSGPVTWSTLGPLFGWWQLPNSINFTKCLYPPACLGSSNLAFKGQYISEDNIDLAMVGVITVGVNATNITCEIQLGFHNESRLCHTCNATSRRKE